MAVQVSEAFASYIVGEIANTEANILSTQEIIAQYEGHLAQHTRRLSDLQAVQSDLDPVVYGD